MTKYVLIVIMFYSFWFFIYFLIVNLSLRKTEQSKICLYVSDTLLSLTMSRHKPQYTFAQLINTVEDLKKLYEQIQKDNELYREHTKRLEERLECVESQYNININNHGGKVRRPKPGEGIISIKTPEKINGFAVPDIHDKPRIKELQNGKPVHVGGGIRVRQEFSQNIQKEQEQENDSLEEEALAELMEVENDLLKIENDETLEFPDIEQQNHGAQVTTKKEQFDLSDIKISQVRGDSDSKDLVTRIENEISAKIKNLDPQTKVEPVKLEPGGDFAIEEKYDNTITHKNFYQKEFSSKDTPEKTVRRNLKIKSSSMGSESATREECDMPDIRITRNKVKTPEISTRPKRQSTETAKSNENGKHRKINETIKNYNEMQSAKGQQIMKSKTRTNKPPSKFDKFEMDEEQVDEAIEEQSKNVIEVKKRTSPSKKVKVYCKCKSTYTKNSPMIGCDGPCQDWYHFDCVGIPQNFRSIAEWYCEDCFFKITNGSIEVCLCGGWFEPAHELVRCKSVCKKLYHPGCLGLDNEAMVERWEEERGGRCGYCNS